MDFKEIENFIELVKNSGVLEVEVESADLKIKVKNYPKKKKTGSEQVTDNNENPIQITKKTIESPISKIVQRITTPESPVIIPETTTDPKGQKLFTIKSPMVGTFYRRPSPDKPDYVKVGDVITKGMVIFNIESMKLFNEFESDVVGKIRKILVENGVPVEFDQPLILIEL